MDQIFWTINTLFYVGLIGDVIFICATKDQKEQQNKHY